MRTLISLVILLYTENLFSFTTHFVCRCITAPVMFSYCITNEYSVEIDTLWRQGLNSWGGSLLYWNDDLSEWAAAISRSMLTRVESAVMTKNFLSEWFQAGVSNTAGILEDGTVLYYGSDSGNVYYLGIGEKLIGPYKIGAGDFYIFENGSHWAKVIGKGSGYVLLYDGEEISGIYDQIDKVQFDYVSGEIIFRFMKDDHYGIAGSKRGVLFTSEWIGKVISIKNGDIYCEIGKNGSWTGDNWRGFEAVAKNGDPVSEWHKTLEFFKLIDVSPLYYFIDDEGEWCGVGSEFFGPYESIDEPVFSSGQDFYYAAKNQDGIYSIYKNGERLIFDDYVYTAILPNDSKTVFSQAVCPSGVTFLAVNEIGDYYLIFNERIFGPYENASPPVVSENGEHMAWIIEDINGRLVVLLDAIPKGDAYDEIYKYSLTLSPDGNHIGFIGKTGRSYYLIVDGNKIAGPFADPALAGRIGTTLSDIYITDDSLVFLGDCLHIIKGVSLLRVTVKFN